MLLATFSCVCNGLFQLSGHPHLLWPPVLGQKSVRWDQVFSLIQQPDQLWESWKPSKTLDKYDLKSLWECYVLGEPVFDPMGMQTGIKPPLQLVEQHFQSSWRGRSPGVCLNDLF
jgi:hypothetical protein